MYDKENGAGPLAVIIFLVAFFLIGLAALFSFIITNKTYEYKINNKNYVVYGDVLKLEEMLLKGEVNKLIELGMEDFQEVSNIKDNKIYLTVDNKNIIIELNKDNKITNVYNKSNNHLYYSQDEDKDLYYYKDDSLKKAHNKSEDIIKPDESAVGKSKTLLEGSWTVGSNIEEGIYNLHALSGNGNLYIKTDKNRLKVNILLGVGNQYNTKNNVYLKDYNNVTLEKGDIITIGKDMKIKFNAIK